MDLTPKCVDPSIGPALPVDPEALCYAWHRSGPSTEIPRGAAPPRGAAHTWRRVLISVVVLGFLAVLDLVRPVVFVYVLRTRLVNGLALLAGWTLALAVLFVVACAALAGGITAGPGARQRGAASLVELAIGGALLVVAVGCWRARDDGPPRDGYAQAVLRRVDRLDVRRSALVGVLIQPRALTVAAAVVVSRDRAGLLGLLVGLLVFGIVSTAALIGILVYDVWRPERAAVRLGVVVSALERQGPLVVTALLAAAGAYLVVDGLRDLVL